MTETTKTSIRAASRIRLDLVRNDVALLIDCLEEVIEGYKYDGGLSLAEDELRLHEFLEDRLHRHDGSHKYRRKASGALK